MQRMFLSWPRRPKNLERRRTSHARHSETIYSPTQKFRPLTLYKCRIYCSYLFTTAEKMVRIQIAEVIYRHDHGHPNALDILLACTLPLAEKTARYRAHKFFTPPSDWQIELMYDGAVAAMIAVFQYNYALEPGTNAFKRYIVRALALGTVRSYFMREEND